ncbi:hypothetical protein B7463_g8702, partial [Scytalidium lignicola]
MASTCPNPSLNTPNTIWSFCASLPAAYVFLSFFSLTAVAHIIQAVLYKKAYCWVIIVSALWQVATYTLRILSINNPTSYGLYAGWFVLIMVRQDSINDAGRAVMDEWIRIYGYGKDDLEFLGTTEGYGCILCFDCTANIAVASTFIVQVVGAANAAKNNEPINQVLHAIHVYMVGVGIQEGFILVFATFAIRFHYILLRTPTIERKSNAVQLLYATYIVLILITVSTPRIIFFTALAYDEIGNRFVSSSASASTQTASTAQYLITKHSKTV